MKVAGLLLAAGGSKRLGQPKQLLDYRGQTLVRRMANALIGGGCSSVEVVVGRDHEAVRTALKDLPVRLVPNEQWEEGIGSSIRAGIRALSTFDAVVIAACDQPHVNAGLICRLVSTQKKTQHSIVASAYEGTVGVPALFTLRHRDALSSLPNECGAKTIIAIHEDELATVDFPEGAIDIDTPADFRALRLAENPPI